MRLKTEKSVLVEVSVMFPVPPMSVKGGEKDLSTGPPPPEGSGCCEGWGEQGGEGEEDGGVGDVHCGCGVGLTWS